MAPIKVGILGAGEVAQVIHLPTLALLPHLYTVTSISDVSATRAAHCATKFHIPHHTTDSHATIAHPDVSLVFVLTSDDSHAALAIAALEAGKDVFLEKPVTLSLPAAQRILDAERRSGGRRVFVGYMRRYAPSFVQAFKREVASIPRVLYARCRDFSGPNATFVSQSGTFPLPAAAAAAGDVPAEVGRESERAMGELLAEAWGGKEVTEERRRYTRFLGSLGSHDISLMREVLGTPESVAGVSVHDPFYTAIFTYRNQTSSGEPFAVTYESGIDGVPSFDAHLAIYGERKRVAIHYDSPYVKGLPILVRVEELNEHGEFQTREVRASYEDAYTAELREMHRGLTEGLPFKTTVADAMEDLRVYEMMYRRFEEGRS